MKILYIPFSLAGGLIAGLIAKKMVAAIWGMVDDQDPPKPEHRDVSAGKLAAAVTLEGAVMALTRGMTDHASRRAFEYLTGAWPGEEAPERKE